MKSDLRYPDYSQAFQHPVLVRRITELSNVVVWPKETVVVLTDAEPKQYEQMPYTQTVFSPRSVGETGIDIRFTMPTPPVENRVARSRSIAREFERLVEEWKKDTFAVSSLSKIYAHPAYQRIIGMGPEALPLVLRELQKNQGHWFYALKFMAGEDGETVAAGINNFEDAKAAWLEWGYRNNQI